MPNILYTDNNAYCTSWITNLIMSGWLPPGTVATLDIADLDLDFVAGFDQVHLCCGLGGWPLAVGMCQWEGPIWTASLPCQPWSQAGKKAAGNDERNLLLDFMRLVDHAKPTVIVGEQVKSELGRDWLTFLRFYLEKRSYEFGAANLPAASIGLPQSRSRYYFVADTYGQRLERTKSRPSELSSWETLAARNKYSVLARCDHQTNALPICEVDGIPRPVGAISAFGNAIVPDLAALVLHSYRQTLAERFSQYAERTSL